jgi:hypothetical protein
VADRILDVRLGEPDDAMGGADRAGTQEDRAGDEDRLVAGLVPRLVLPRHSAIASWGTTGWWSVRFEPALPGRSIAASGPRGRVVPRPAGMKAELARRRLAGGRGSVPEQPAAPPGVGICAS